MNYNEIGLSVLSWVKKISGKEVDVTGLPNAPKPTIKHDGWNQILQQYVSADGSVDYAGLLNKQNRLNEYLALLSESPPGNNWNAQQILAYWINAYNAFTVKLILDHYPLDSIKDISSGLPMINSPWDIKFFNIDGIPFDLNTIEHDILRKLDEPRIHFAINCASFSCPVLRNEAYTAEDLEHQLEEQTRLFINNPDKNDISEGVLSISKIFEWFSSDFSSLGGVKTLLKKHHELYNDQNDIQYLEYNWSLNRS